MNITVNAQTFPLTPTIEACVRQRLSSALQRFHDDVVAVNVSLKDINGPRGGAVKQVSLLIRLPQGRVVPVEVVRADLYAAIRQSARASKRAVKHMLSKRRKIAWRALRRLRPIGAPAPLPA